MNKVLVSILVPVYNTSKYLHQCMTSLINQSLTNIEFICINDGSTDNSLDILKEYAKNDSRIVIIDKENTGYGHSMNKGLLKAKGKYIGIVESDDFVEDIMFESLYNTAKKEKVDVVKSNFYKYKNFKGEECIKEEILRECEYNRVFNPIQNQNIFQVQGCIWSAIYNRDFLLNNNIYFNETPGASFQDISFNIKVWSTAKKVILLKDAYLKYRVDNQNSSVKSPSKIFCVYDEFEEVYKFLNNKEEIKSKIKDSLLKLKYRIYLENYYRVTSVFEYSALSRLKEELIKDYKFIIEAKKSWDDRELQILEEILEDDEKFFKRTSKGYEDSRLSGFNTLNSKVYLTGLLNLVSCYEHIIIYGAGIIGRDVAKFLLQNERSIYSFLVTNIEDNPKKIMDINIESMTGLNNKKENSIVLVSIHESNQFEVVEALEENKYKNIILIDKKLLRYIRESLYLK